MQDYVIAFEVKTYDGKRPYTDYGFIYAKSFEQAAKILEDYYEEGIAGLRMFAYQGPIIVTKNTFNAVIKEMETI